MKAMLPLTAAALAGLLAISPAAFAADEYNLSTGLTAVGAPLGLHGVDPVALVTAGDRLDGIAEYAAVVDGKLYVFLNKQIFAMFKEDRGGTIAWAAEKWPRIRHVAARDL